MIMLTRLDGNPVCVNEINVLWVEALPDTSVMLVGGTRMLVRESVSEVKNLIDGRAAIVAEPPAANQSDGASMGSSGAGPS